MEISEVLEKLNNSDLGKNLRAKKLKLSQSTIDEINKKYDINLDSDFLEKLVSFGLLKLKLSPELYQEIIERNEYKFSNIQDVENVLKNSIECSFLTPENVQMFKEILEVSGITKIKLNNISPEIADLSSLPLDELEVGFGDANKETFEKFPKLKSLKIMNVAFNSISEMESLSRDLTSLEIFVHPDDPQLDMIDIVNFKSLTNFDISGQTLTQEDFERICTLSKLKTLDLGNGKILKDYHCEGNKINDFSSVLNLFNLENISSGDSLYSFCLTPIITNAENFRKLLNFKYFKNLKNKRVIYMGSEPLPVDLLDGIDSIELRILSPFAIEKDFAEKYENGFPGSLKIESDIYEHYTAPEVYAISQKMKEIIDGIPKDASDFDKVSAIYKSIGELCFYDRSGCIGDEEYIEGRENITRSLRGGFIENKLVCRGYALNFKKLADELGIESTIISGTAIDPKTNEVLGDHAWNQVKIDGQWYNLDLTWDARSIRAQTDLENFLLSDEEFYKEHVAHSVDDDIRRYIQGDGFDYLRYKNSLYKSEKPHECSQSYDKSKITEFFETRKREIVPSKSIVEKVAHSENVTINQIESNMALMTSVEKDRGNTEEKQTEERNG